MQNEILPLKLPEIDESIYAGFWRRLAAIMLDIVIISPFLVLLLYLNKLDRLATLYTCLPSLCIFFIYHIYFVKRWGGTPGKLIAKIRIVAKNGLKAGWREAFLRQSVDLGLRIISDLSYITALLRLTDNEFLRMDFMQLHTRLDALTPNWGRPIIWLLNIWIWSELIVLLTNKRRRAIHDFIGGTVVIKAKYKERAEQAAIKRRG